MILFDEPCSALDPISTAKIEELIDELKDDYTIVIVTHNMQQAARVSDFTAFMYLGELIEFDTTSKMFTAPQRPAHAGLHHRPLRLTARRRQDECTIMTEHTAKAFDVDLQELTRMVAEMGGLAEKQIADCGRRAGRARRRAAPSAWSPPTRRSTRCSARSRRRPILTIARRQPMAVDLREIVGALRVVQRSRADRRPRQEHRQARAARSTATSIRRS